MYHQLLVNTLIKWNLGVIEATPSKEVATEVNSIAPPPSLKRACPRAREVENMSTQLPQP
jgi:hypothetical protein